MTEFAILGAGIAGISAAYHLQQRGIKTVTVYEASDEVGGLLANFTVDGFRFDKGVHLSFTTDSYVRSVFDRTPHIKHLPDPYNYEGGRWLKHPVQNNLYPLPTTDKVEAVKSFLQRPGLADATNYRDWLIHQYGEYIAERFPLRYTEKYWTVPAEQLSVEWVSNRMYLPSLDEILFGAFTDETPDTYYAKEMRYPRSGGYKSFLQPMLEGCNIRLNKKVVRIYPDQKALEFECGDKQHFDTIACSFPLPETVRLIKDAPRSVVEAAEQLWATSVALVSVGFKRPDVPRYLWFYIYDSELLSARVNSPSLKSPDNAPEGCSSLQFEYYFSRLKPLEFGHDALIEHTIASLVRMGIATPDEVCIAECRVLPYGNVVFTRDMLACREKIRSYLSSLGIASIGRFGEWDYLWSDQAFLSGKRAADQIDA